MTAKHALALLAAGWLLAACAAFGEGLARGVMAQSEEPAEDTRQCEVSGPAFTGILPLLEQQQGYPSIGHAGPERPILKVIMVHGEGAQADQTAAPTSERRRRGAPAGRCATIINVSDRFEQAIEIATARDDLTRRA